MEMNWMAGNENVKCFADKDESGARKRRVLVGSGKDDQQVERFRDCGRVYTTEEEAVIAATAWARPRMPDKPRHSPHRGGALSACRMRGSAPTHESPNQLASLRRSR